VSRILKTEIREDTRKRKDGLEEGNNYGIEMAKQ
jgi:hypothetical protein